jgi:hypothetical protein
MQSCKVVQLWRVTRAKEGFIASGWIDGPMSCSCNDPEEPYLIRCLKRFMQTANDGLQWLADHPPHPPVLPGPIPVPLPVPI